MKTESTIETICRDAELARHRMEDRQQQRSSDYVRMLRRHRAEGWVLDARDQALLDRADGVVR